MPRISNDTPMKAYDHVQKLLEKAGRRDGVVSRDDAKKLVQDLQKEGRGTEALAAENIFKMIDARDAQPGNRVTGYDLKKDRSFVESKMLENRDIDGNGLARSEIEKMSTTGRALVELGRFLDLDTAAGRVAHATPERGLYHVAGMIRAASKHDLITSRADADKYADRLMGEGRGTEALAFRTFFSFIDHRDDRVGGRITDADITKAVDYASRSLLENKDQTGDGYSKNEIAKFSTSAKAFLLLGQMIEAGLIKSAMPTDGHGVQKALAEQVKGLEFDQMGSEGGAGLKAVFRDGNFDKVDEKTFRKAFDMPNRAIQVVDKFTAEDLRTFIETNASTYQDGKVVEDPVASEKAFNTTAMLRSLTDLKVLVTGKGDEGALATYIVGIAPDKSMVGLQTSVVWT